MEKRRSDGEESRKTNKGDNGDERYGQGDARIEEEARKSQLRATEKRLKEKYPEGSGSRSGEICPEPDFGHTNIGSEAERQCSTATDGPGPSPSLATQWPSGDSGGMASLDYCTYYLQSYYCGVRVVRALSSETSNSSPIPHPVLSEHPLSDFSCTCVRIEPRDAAASANQPTNIALDRA